MEIVPIPISINVRNGIVMIEDDSIKLHTHQVRKIKKNSIRKTKEAWIKGNTGIKFPLTTSQKTELVEVKEKIIRYLSPSKDPKIILETREGFGFTNHAFVRAMERIERLSKEEMDTLSTNGRQHEYPIHPETLEKLVESLISSKEVDLYAEWKGYPFLNYNFICLFDDREIKVTVNFEIGILIITLVVIKESGYFVREVYSIENNEIKKTPSKSN